LRRLLSANVVARRNRGRRLRYPHEFQSPVEGPVGGPVRCLPQHRIGVRSCITTWRSEPGPNGSALHRVSAAMAKSGSDWSGQSPPAQGEIGVVVKLPYRLAEPAWSSPLVRSLCAAAPVTGLLAVCSNARVCSAKEVICRDRAKHRRQRIAHLMTATYAGRQQRVTHHRRLDYWPMTQRLRSSVISCVSSVRETTSARAKTLRR